MPNNNVYIGLINPKSPANVGAVMRAVGCYQASGIIYTGERYARAAKFNTDTKRISQTIPLKGTQDLFATEIINTMSKNTKIICVDLIEGATPLPEFTHPENAYYIFGPEDGTVSQEIVNKADAVVYVPTVGCMNLAASVNVVLYDRLAKLVSHQGNDELIRRSRDTNNQVKVNQPFKKD